MSKRNILDELNAKLIEVASYSEVPMDGVHYGFAPSGTTSWNRLIISRSDVVPYQTDYTTHYFVTITHEDYIPEGYLAYVINKLQDIKGLKVTSSSNIPFSYGRKGNTDVVVEVATITLTKANMKAEFNG